MNNKKTVDPVEAMKKINEEGTERFARIAANNFHESLQPAEFMGLATTVYDLCTQSSPHLQTQELYAEYGRAVEKYVKDTVVVRLSGKRDEFLLQTLVSEYKNFKIYIRMMKNVFEYLNRFYVTRQAVPRLEDVGTMKFDEGIFAKGTGDEIRKATLTLIQKDREGEKIDRQLVRSITSIYVELGAHEDNDDEKYRKGFEEQFLSDTTNFYAAKSAVWLRDSLPEYLIAAEAVLLREKQLANDCLPSFTLAKLERVLDQEILINHQTTLLEREQGGFSVLLTDMRKADLARMYFLFGRVESDGLTPLANQFCTFVTKKGKELVETFDPSKTSSSEAVVEFVNKMIAMHDAYDSLLTDCFNKSGLFSKAMTSAFESFVNREMGPAGSKVMCAELLSAYCDTLLKSSGEKLSDDALEEKLSKVVQVFAYLTDKDMFSEYYRKQLARRLLQKKSASDDAELRMLEMLKLKCGAQFTSKLEGMVKDLTMSKEHQMNFKEYLSNLEGANRLGIDCEVQVLTTGYWPSYTMLEVDLPSEIVRCMDVFKTFYELNTKHRRLRWLHSMGQVSLIAQYNKKYELIVSTPQSCILMLYNEIEKLTFDEVRGRLNLTEEEATRQLLTLSAGKFKLLKKDPPGKTIKPTDSFTINVKFSADKKRIKVPTISSKELVKEDKESTTQAVQEDRKHAIEAAIVRIMKARKQLDFQKLVLETSQQLIRLFKPDVKLIKARMEDLIAREYIERDPDNPKILRYLA